MGDRLFQASPAARRQLLEQRALALAQLSEAEERDDRVGAAAARKVVQDLQRVLRQDGLHN